MVPCFNEAGNLPAGIHWATWEEITNRFGTSDYRRKLLSGMRAALESLKTAGRHTVYIETGDPKGIVALDLQRLL